MNNLATRGVFGMVVSVSTAGWLAGWLAGGNRCMTDDDNDNEIRHPPRGSCIRRRQSTFLSLNDTMQEVS